MSIQSIGNSPKFTARLTSEEFLNMDNHDLKQIAIEKANQDVNDKKHKLIDQTLFASIPFVAGLSSAALTKDTATFFGTPVIGRAAKVANGVKEAGRWAGMFAVLDLTMLGLKELNKNSKDVRSFNKNHPFLASLGSIALGLGAISLAEKGFYKALNHLKPETLKKCQNKIANYATKINKDSLLKAIGEKVSKMVSKMPSALKSTGKTALAWAPLAILVGGLIHNINHSEVRNREAVNNYKALKTLQEGLKEQAEQV